MRVDEVKNVSATAAAAAKGSKRKKTRDDADGDDAHAGDVVEGRRRRVRVVGR